jgi:malonyl-CoA O-methyltransferase
MQCDNQLGCARHGAERTRLRERRPRDADQALAPVSDRRKGHRIIGRPLRGSAASCSSLQAGGYNLHSPFYARVFSARQVGVRMAATLPEPRPDAPGQLDTAQVRRASPRAGADAGCVRQRVSTQHEVARRMLERLEYVNLPPALVIDAGCGKRSCAAGIGPTISRGEAAGDRFCAAACCACSSDPERALPHWIARWLPTMMHGPSRRTSSRLPLADAAAGCVWSNLALHWVNDPATVFIEWERVLRNGGLAQFSLLGPDTLKEPGRRGVTGAGPMCIVHRHARHRRHVDPRRLPADPVMDMETITRPIRRSTTHRRTARGGRGRTATAATAWLTGSAWRDALGVRIDADRRQGARDVRGRLRPRLKPDPLPGRPGRTGEAVVRVEISGAA